MATTKSCRSCFLTDKQTKVVTVYYYGLPYDFCKFHAGSFQVKFENNPGLRNRLLTDSRKAQIVG